MRKCRFIVFILSVILMQGCIMRSQQLSNLVHIIRMPETDFSQNRWLVKYKDYESIVYSVNVARGTLFSNMSGDSILFDGWIVREVRGMGQFKINDRISGESEIRSFFSRNIYSGDHICASWMKENNDGYNRFSQTCEDFGNRRYENTILVEPNGSIDVIRQIIDFSDTSLTLTKVQ